MDYTALIDDEIWAFIQKTAQAYPEDAATRPIADQRAIYDEMCRLFLQPYPAGVASSDVSANGVPVRVYTAGTPTRSVVFFHGGGFVVGGLESHDDVCAELCAQTGYRVISVDYRLAPEHKHPAAFNDAWDATNWAAQQFNDPLILAGDSAGGNLAAAVAHHARGRLDGVLGQVLIYPGLGGSIDSGSAVDHAHAPMLTRDELLFYRDIRLDGAEPVNDPTYAPLHDSSFANLPPTVVISADCDPLRDDAPAYAKAVQAAGGKAHWINEPGLVHGYLRARTMSRRAQASFERISVAIEALGQDIWPYD